MSQDQWNNNNGSNNYNSPDQTEQFASQPQYPTNGQYMAPAPYGNVAVQEQPKKNNTGKVVATAALVAALVGGGVGAGVTYATGHSSSASIATTTNAGTTIVNNTDSVNAVTAAAAKATPSVVTISVTSGSSSSSSSASGSGSGIVLDNEGHILTNTHVVTLDGEISNPTVEVKFSDGTVKKAEIVGTDPTSDLAVIKIDPSGMTLTPASLGDSSKLNVGDVAIAIGAPLGLENTVTDGIISNLNRTIEIASSAAPSEGSDSSSSDSNSNNPFGNSPFQFEMPGQQQSQSSSSSSTISINVLQTDAAVNPGNSGGALVNSNGEVIGVNVAIASADSSSSSSSSQSGNIGVGFSIPIDYAKRIAQEIIDNGSATHGLLGASVADSPANDDSSQVFSDGAVIKSLTSDSAASNAGLKEGDVITKFGDKTISSATELTAAVRQQAANSKVEVTYLRNGKEATTEVTLGTSSSK